MTILITGGLGHIGSHLASTLRARGYKVIVSDLKILKEDGYVRGDVCSFVEMHRIFKEHRINHVYHLAGEVGRENGELFPRRCVDVNVSGTLNLIQLCLEHNAKLYFASTSEVYGKLADQYKLTEDLIDIHPSSLTNCYAISKLQAEDYLKHFCAHYSLEALSFRFFMCYGDGEYPIPYRSAMTNFVYRILTDQPISVHTGTARSWCYVSDIVEGCILAMEHQNPGGYEAYNIGRDELVDTTRVAEIICELSGKPKSLINYTEPNWLVTSVKNASFDKAKIKLNYESKIPLEEGIARTIAWQRKVILGEG
jgi:nucleoside-diphosphate-sugar epimerase